MATEQLVRKRYKNPRSGVRYYACGPAFIHVWFKDGRGYEYNQTRPGRHHVETMKRLAEAGRGLATYINQHIGKNFSRHL
jgi:hypothetical protein